MAIYIKIGVIPETIKEFFEYFYSQLDIGILAYGLTTYKNKELTEIQCVYNTYRSFDDLLELAETYYEDVDAKKVTEALLNIEVYGKGRLNPYMPHLGTCSTMQKIRYIPHISISDEYENVNIKMPDSKHTWKELLEMLGINDEIEFKAYLKNRKLNK